MNEVDEFIQRHKDVEVAYCREHLDRSIFEVCLHAPQHADVRQVFGKVCGSL